MTVTAHRHRETFSHLIGSYGYIYMGGYPTLYIDVHLVAHGQVPNSFLSWNCRRSATSGYQCVPLGVLAKVMRNEE